MHIFVYGTLLSNIPSSMSKFLRRRASLVGKATVHGKLYDLGMYPGFIAGGEDNVIGELYLVKPENEEQTIEMLDAYEGVTGEAEDEYRRVELEAKVGGGGTFTAQTYEFTGSLAGKALIAKGNYPAFYTDSEEHARFVNGE